MEAKPNTKEQNEYLKKVVGGDIRDDEHECLFCPIPCPVIQKQREKRKAELLKNLEKLKKESSK